MTPYDCYCKYLAVKTHFTSDKGYDYHRYGGMMKVKQDTFDIRKDKYFFYKLSKKEDPTGYLIANFSRNNTSWIGNMLDNPISDINYDNWKKIKDSLTYHVKSQLSTLNDDLSELLACPEDGNPLLLDLFATEQVSPETFCALQTAFNFLPYWETKLSEYDPLFRNTKIMYYKYYRFLDYDRPKMATMLKDRFNIPNN